MSLVNIGNDKYNINLDTAKGLEKVIGIIASFVVKAQNKLDTILYGKRSSNSSASKFRKALDRGIIYILKELSSVDFCNILNYSLNSIKLGDISFNPNGPPDNASDQEIKKWKIQKRAYDLQKTIDKFYGEFGGVNNVGSTLGLLNLVKSINLAIDTILSSREGLNDPNLVKNFPEISLITNYLNNVKADINSFVESGFIPTEQVEKTLTTVEKVRQTLIGIQALNTPAALISSIDTFAVGAIQREFARINAIIDTPSRIIPRIKELIKLVNNTVSVARSIAGYINLAKTIVTVVLLLIRVFNVIKAFFITLPIPGLATTLGITVATNKTYQQVLEEQGTKKLITRLNQMNLVLGLIAYFANGLVAAMDQILLSLRAILLNLQSCNNVDEDLILEIESAITNTESAIEPLKKFLNDIDRAENAKQNTFGEYTIEIITEEVVDDAIRLRRRYGIARNNRNQIVVESTPTFASLDLIIINEVKVLLVSRGFVKMGLTDMSSDDLLTVIESLKFLGEIDINLDNIQNLNTIDFGNVDIPDSQSEIGLQGFVNNLPGGKALRERVRAKMIQNNQKLGQDLKQSDPNSKYTSNISQQTESQTKKLKIEQLTEEREKQSKLLIASATNPIASAAIIKKIKDIDEQLKQLKNS